MGWFFAGHSIRRIAQVACMPSNIDPQQAGNLSPIAPAIGIFSSTGHQKTPSTLVVGVFLILFGNENSANCEDQKMFSLQQSQFAPSEARISISPTGHQKFPPTFVGGIFCALSGKSLKLPVCPQISIRSKPATCRLSPDRHILPTGHQQKPLLHGVVFCWSFYQKNCSSCLYALK